ncbi:hypothetical protein [Streptomyces californicus]|uniref:hypothetical protein n=1 Tax=Streptomyces californicus TaxID=67351 RepID=UPI00379FFEB1
MGTTGRGPVAQDPAGGNGRAEQESSAFRRTLAGLRLTFTSGVTGAAASAVVVGVILGRAPVFLTGGGVLLLLVLIGFVAGRRSPGPDAPPVTRTALARIEDLRATNGESADVPVEFRLTVAPEPAPAETLHVQMLPYELFPALVREARTTLGVRTPESWRIDVAPDPGAWQGVGPRVRVTVTGEEGTAHLDADATARIVERRPVAKAG